MHAFGCKVISTSLSGAQMSSLLQMCWQYCNTQMQQCPCTHMCTYGAFLNTTGQYCRSGAADVSWCLIVFVVVVVVFNYNAKFLLLTSLDLQTACPFFAGPPFLVHPSSCKRLNFTNSRSVEVDDFWQDRGWSVLYFPPLGKAKTSQSYWCETTLPVYCRYRLYPHLHKHNCY